MSPAGDEAKRITDAQIEAALLGALAHRDEQSSACPSEIARDLERGAGEAWRQLMPRIRQVIARLAREERLRITRGTSALAPDDLSGGPIRIRRGRRFT